LGHEPRVFAGVLLAVLRLVGPRLADLRLVPVHLPRGTLHDTVPDVMIFGRVMRGLAHDPVLFVETVLTMTAEMTGRTETDVLHMDKFEVFVNVIVIDVTNVFLHVIHDALTSKFKDS
jgi:hypothetical protein